MLAPQQVLQGTVIALGMWIQYLTDCSGIAGVTWPQDFPLLTCSSRPCLIWPWSSWLSLLQPTGYQLIAWLSCVFLRGPHGLVQARLCKSPRQCGCTKRGMRQALRVLNRHHPALLCLLRTIL